MVRMAASYPSGRGFNPCCQRGLTILKRAVVAAQLVEQSLMTPEIASSNPDIGKILSTNCTIEKMKIKKKRPGMALHMETILYSVRQKRPV